MLNVLNDGNKKKISNRGERNALQALLCSSLIRPEQTSEAVRWRNTKCVWLRSEPSFIVEGSLMIMRLLEKEIRCYNKLSCVNIVKIFSFRFEVFRID